MGDVAIVPGAKQYANVSIARGAQLVVSNRSCSISYIQGTFTIQFVNQQWMTDPFWTMPWVLQQWTMYLRLQDSFCFCFILLPLLQRKCWRQKTWDRYPKDIVSYERNFKQPSTLKPMDFKRFHLQQSHWWHILAPGTEFHGGWQPAMWSCCSLVDDESSR